MVLVITVAAVRADTLTGFVAGAYLVEKSIPDSSKPSAGPEEISVWAVSPLRFGLVLGEDRPALR